MQTVTGLEVLIGDKHLQKSINGNIAYLCHNASVTRNYQWGPQLLKDIYKDRFKKIFSPQHGLFTDVQDNMVESDSFYFDPLKIEVCSLYSNVRRPTNKMLEGIETVLVDLQDVGTRTYTYISTLALLMEACSQKDIEIIILDRPNPIGGEMVEGNVSTLEFKSFVAHYPMASRHGMTMGEIARYFQKNFVENAKISVIKMQNWSRATNFFQTNLPWINPSPNLPTIESSFTYGATVFFEGTNISEGRGTTRSLELVGIPGIEPFSFVKNLQKLAADCGLDGMVLRPIVFKPTFNKFSGENCGGVFIHVTDFKNFKAWRLGQFLCRQFYVNLGDKFAWNHAPYEYEFEGYAIDYINGSSKIRAWIESSGDVDELVEMEYESLKKFLTLRSDCLIY